MRRHLTVLATAATLAAPCALLAQDSTSLPRVSTDTAQLLPTDPHVIIGTLPNGLRYYIRENHKPEHRAELRLAVNAGSVLEDDDQRGLAHFVEHMAFNGTTHFAKQAMVNYLESIGMRFGADVNASTGFDETVFTITVPTDSTRIVDKSMQILEDWAHGLTFDTTEINKERGVVIEEWRLGQGAGSRMRDKQFPVIFQDSRYAVRLPIGEKSTLETFTRDRITRFYHDWYRPDLMAVVAVGDFDARAMETLIRQHFAHLTNPSPERARTMYPVPDRDSTRYAIATDPEATSSSVGVYYMQPPARDTTVGAYRRGMIENLYNSMLNERLDELAQQPNPPFIGASSSEGQLIRSKDAYVLGAAVKDGGIRHGLDAILTEAERVKRYGFTASELERQKTEMLRGMEQAYAERDKTNSAAYAGEYVDSYLDGEPSPGIAYEYALTKALLPGITLAEVNALATHWLSDPNRVVLVNAPQKAGVTVPTAQELAAVFDSVRAKTITPYKDALADAPLIAHEPAPGHVVSTKTIDSIGVTEWTLSNGVRVILKPTDFKADQILVGAYSPGGTSLASNADYIAATTAAGVVRMGGVGGFDFIQLQKALAGKVVGLTPYISDLTEGMSGSASPTDAQTLFQLIYLYFTAPREDSSAFRAFQARVKESLANRDASPLAAFEDTVEVTMAQHNFRARPLSSKLFDEMNLDKSLAFYRDRFADASDFTFIFVGNFTPAQLRPLVERYLGGLPSTHRQEHWRDEGIRAPKGVIRKVVRKGLEPKSETELVFTGPFHFTRANVHALNAMADVLEIKLRESLREAMGGTYDVTVQATASRDPRQDYEVRIDFGSAPERVAELTKAVFQQIDSLATLPDTDSDLRKVRETEIRERETNMKQNGYWLSALETYDRYGWDPRAIGSADLIQRTNAAMVRDAAKQYLNRKNYVQVSLYPEGGKAGSSRR
ncbi:MAG TPA: insulinase family protein [Gemmatimonadaceae bacterium]